MRTSFTSVVQLLIVGLLMSAPALALAANSNLSTLQGILISTLFFMQNILLPFLFSVAFLYFLVNMARYYVIGGAKSDSHSEAKSNAIYGIAAFVFMFSLWGIVSIMLNGLHIDNGPSACPEYLVQFGGGCNSTVGSTFGGGTTFTNNTGSRGSYSGGTGSYTGGTGSYTGGTGNYTGGTGSYNGGSGTYTGGTGNYPGGSGNYNGTAGANTSLASLIFGNGKDSAAFITNPGAPRGLTSSPNIAPAATCQAGIQTSLLASKTETSQFAYALYVSPNGSARWLNVTDTAGANGIGYDKDTLDALMQQGPSNIYLVTVHPESRITSQSLAMNGEGPTAADLAAMCTSGHTGHITYITVDRGGIWTTTQNASHCPLTASTTAQLPLIETFNDLAMLPASNRNAQLATYLNSSVTPAPYKTALSQYQNTDFGTLGANQIETMANPYKSAAGININYTTDVNTFCAGLTQ